MDPLRLAPLEEVCLVLPPDAEDPPPLLRLLSLLILCCVICLSTRTSVVVVRCKEDFCLNGYLYPPIFILYLEKTMAHAIAPTAEPAMMAIRITEAGFGGSVSFFGSSGESVTDPLIFPDIPEP